MVVSVPFFHQHPYEIYIPPGTWRIIIGTLPPPRFSLGGLKKRDVNFCYGSCDSMLWPVLEKIYTTPLKYDNSSEAVDQRKELLIKNHLGICDIVESCWRKKIDASDLGMYDLTLRDILLQIELHSSLNTLIFVGGNSKNGPEYLFRKQLKLHKVVFKQLDDSIPRRHYFVYNDRRIETVSLISPSNAANRAIGSTALYKRRKLSNPAYSTFEYRVEQYGKVLLG